MEYEVQDRVCAKKTLRHVYLTGRVPWFTVDGGSRYRMIDDQDRCEWLHVYSGTGSSR